MSKTIDCLLIGSSEMEFKKVEKITRVFGTNTPVYRNLNLRFLHYNNQPQAIFDLFKLIGHDKYEENLPETGEKFEMFSTAIAYLGTYLKKNSYSFDYINSFFHEKNDLAEKLKNDKILTIAILTTHYGTPFPIRDIVSFIKKHNTTAKIIIGGPYIWGEFRSSEENEIQSLLHSLNADFYVDSSQGETTLIKIIESLKSNIPFEQIPNIHYKSGNTFISTNLITENNDLGDNIVDWSLFADVVPKQIYIRTAISCPFRCSFCEFHSRMGEYKYIDVKNIEKELNTIEKIGKVKSIHFIDDTFNVPVERFKNILRMMIRNKYSFKWSSLFRCQYADEEMVELMSQSGCEFVHLGIESGNPTILKNMNKKATIEQYEIGMAMLKKYKISTVASFIIGFPGETKETVQDTINYIERIKPTFYMLHPWYCSRLTPIWNDREKYGLSSQQWGFNWKHQTMDSGEAIEYVEYMLVKIKNSIHSCLHLQEITMLMNYGFSLNQIEQFILAYNDGLAEKLKNNNTKDISPEIFERMKSALAYE